MATVNTTEPKMRDQFGSLVDNPNYRPASSLSIADQMAANDRAINGGGASVGSTPKDVYGNYLPDNGILDAENARLANARADANAPIDEKALKANMLANFQAEVDAINSVYADKISRAKVEGRGRLGQAGAIQARRGLLGSDFATAQTAEVAAGNEDIYSSLENEKAMKLGAINSKVNELAMAELKEKRAARAAGLDATLKNLSESETRKKADAKEIAAAIIAQGLKPEEMDDVLFNGYERTRGVTKDQIIASYSEMKKAQDEKAAALALSTEKTNADILKTKADTIKAGIESGKYYEVGGRIYDSNNKFIANKFDTTGGGGGTTVGTYKLGENPTVDAWATRINNGQAKLSDISGAKNIGLKNQVVQALNGMSGGKLGYIQTNLTEAKKLVDELILAPGREAVTGVPNMFTNPFGMSLPSSNAREFKAKIKRLDALLFLDVVPQMRGLGQLTEREGAKLSQSQSVLNETGIGDPEYLLELTRLSTKLGAASEAIGGQALKDVGANTVNPDQEMLDAGYTQQQIDEIKNAE